MTDLSFSTALNIAKTAKERFILEQYKQLNELEKYAAKNSYNNYISKKDNLIKSILGSNKSLGCLDDLIIAEYALTSLSVHNINVNGQYKKLLAKLIASMHNSSSSEFSYSIMGFTWNNANQGELWDLLICNNYVLLTEFRDIIGSEWLTNYDAYTLNQIIRKIHTLKGRKEFCNYYAEHRNKLYTYKMASEVVECFVSNCRATERDISDIENYRGIIDGTETY